jgi:hypothetical protein
MTRKLYARLAQLERAYAAARRAKSDVSQGESAVEWVREFLRTQGIDPGPRPKESLAETFARALGITSKELKSHLKAGTLTEVLSRCPILEGASSMDAQLGRRPG